MDSKQPVKGSYSKPYLIYYCFTFNYFLPLCFMIFASVERSLFLFNSYLMPYLLLSFRMCLADCQISILYIHFFFGPSVHEQKFTIN